MTDGLQGSEVLSLIRQTHSAVSTEVQGARDHLDRLEHAARERISRRGETVLQLARHYLPDISGESVAQSFAGVRDDLRQVLAEKQQREAELRRRWEQALDRRAALEAELDKATAELDALVERRERLEQQLADRLAEDQDFTAASDQAIAAEAELARNELRVAECRQEAADKLPAYQRSRLFQYLLERRYGTPDYRRRGLTRHLDGWVARLVDFDRSRKSYNFLRVTPEMMAAEVDRRRAEFDALMARVDEIERSRSDEIGLTAALEAGVQAGARRDALVQNIDAEQRQRSEAERQLAQLDGDRSEFYARALARVKRFLESLQQSALESHARATPSPEDDALTAELAGLSRQAEQTQREAAGLREALVARQRTLADLADLARQFSASEFDSHRSVFSDSLRPAERLRSFVRGECSKQDLWRELRSAQRFLPQWVEQRWDRPPVGLDNDFSYVMMRLLAEAAGAMMDHAARGGGGGGFPPAPRRRSAAERPPSVRRRAKGGFTSGRGF